MVTIVTKASVQVLLLLLSSQPWSLAFELYVSVEKMIARKTSRSVYSYFSGHYLAQHLASVCL
jgi:hypothetical protein